jgi:hypothetical protein
MRAAQTMTRDMPGNEGRSGPSTSASHSTWVAVATTSYFRHRLASALRSVTRRSASTCSGLH